MSILDLFAKNQKTVGVKKNQTTYKDKIFEMERTGVNDLVALDLIEPSFSPPKPQDSYIAEMFKDGVQTRNL
jgi:hypothetical protein